LFFLRGPILVFQIVFLFVAPHVRRCCLLFYTGACFPRVFQENPILMSLPPVMLSSSPQVGQSPWSYRAVAPAPAFLCPFFVDFARVFSCCPLLRPDKFPFFFLFTHRPPKPNFKSVFNSLTASSLRKSQM